MYIKARPFDLALDFTRPGQTINRVDQSKPCMKSVHYDFDFHLVFRF